MPHAVSVPSARPSVESALRTLEAEGAGIATLRDALAGALGDDFARAVELIAAASGRVIVTGMGKSGHVGRKITATLASTGTPASFVHPAEASHGDLGMIRNDDVILALSWSGETSELSDIVAYSRRFRVALIGITSNRDSALGREADVCLCLPKAREACPNGLAPTTSTTMQMALGDALAVALLENRGFTSQDFRLYHPGGKLGAQLKQVRSVMHTGERLPVVALGARMADAVVTISAKGFGCVLVVDAQGALVGIVTDGDLRRHMASDLLSRPVEAVMTQNPKAIPPETLVAEALEMVESRKIGALPVVEAGRPVGILHVLDLLRAGAA
ncbi:KpsF/GutQ family sugar-phosphate isomerase [Alsobacter sp. SYSU M60028]|uniref:KpsF/GutQ family sugar-phosphate isomerase n=1 Tax=Alsobacter ponti TaxID=2962936 RepID=A0ABT1LFS7_9HYPH|nr:KpsF/GutQ family sugar-phosphate isomerase [Alsobacter ponti]MCP8939743.1 KpsF/GutQ family sugar-phosphate isomerase [Alsobacter ponti]